MVNKTNECSLSTIHFLDAPLDNTTTAFNLVKEKYTPHFFLSILDLSYNKNNNGNKNVM